MSAKSGIINDLEGSRIPAKIGLAKKPARKSCADPPRAQTCRFAAPSGLWCNRKTYMNRDPKINDITDRCELFAPIVVKRPITLKEIREAEKK